MKSSLAHVELDALGADPHSSARAVATAVASCVDDRLEPGERSWAEAIEALRAQMNASDETIDTALTNRTGTTKPSPLADICAKRSKKAPWGELLMLLVRHRRPATVLELGTCLGISGAYLGAGLQLNGGGRFVTLEGAPALARRAAANFTALGLHADVVPGLFRVTLEVAANHLAPIELAFIDGHHDEEATQTYFAELLPYLADGAIVVFDDIAWSEGMERAWAALRRHPRVVVAVGLERVGICVAGDGEHEPRLYDLPTVTKMRGHGDDTRHSRVEP